MIKNSRSAYFFVAALVVILGVGFFVFGSAFGSRVYVNKALSLSAPGASSTVLAATTTTPSVRHLKTPSAVWSIYMTACAASSATLRAHIFQTLEGTELNSVVINIKDETGKISINTGNPKFTEAYKTAGCPVPDMKQLVESFHKKNIYVIARIAVFQDPFLVKKHPEWAVKRASDGGVWKDRKGISWLEVKAVPVWDYTAELAKESYKLGFDEINLDYIRFPSDGNMNDIAYSFYKPKEEAKHQAVRDFFVGMHNRLKDLGAPISVDLFGMTCTNTDDLGIGQVLEDALPNFDFVAPMIYPSHYPPGWNGYKNPATMPYQVVKINMDAAVKRAIAASSSPSKIRPWIQDFNMGATYDASMIKAQLNAAKAAGLYGYMVWDPKNLYTKAAYLKRATSTTQ
ncbi:MAG: hypothetical protein NTY66_02895 [Candidatus Vogelbacteria bacterium]|nr:hypothetical protein [Candidatus Vogelbacteria bacterium]